MTDLTKLRDDLAEPYGDSADYGDSEQTIFKAGFDAAIQALTEASGEFDISHARFELEKREERVGIEMLEDDPDRFIEGARWQFESDRARIGLAENIVRDREQREHLLRHDIEQLEARNAELIEMSEKTQDEWRECCFKQKDQLKNLEVRLFESEARGSADLVAEKYRLRDKCEQLEARLEDSEMRFADALNLLSSAEARCKELEKESASNLDQLKWSIKNEERYKARIKELSQLLKDKGIR